MIFVSITYAKFYLLLYFRNLIKTMLQLFSKITAFFRNNKVIKPISDLRFGRYSDNNKTVQQTKQWAQALELYNNKEYDKSIDLFFNYLTDTQENNINYTKNENEHTLILYQGTKKIHGTIANNELTANVQVAEMKTPIIAVMRKLLEQNHTLSHSKYVLHDGIIQMQFTTAIKNASPNKLYYALRELATKADKQDDLLIHEFDNIKSIDDDHVKPFAKGEAEIKYTYFVKWITNTLQQCDDLNQDTYSGAIAYLLLTLLYRIDYLICPEGKLLQKVEEINNCYWENKDENVDSVYRNEILKKGLRDILHWSKEDVCKCFYRARATFAANTPRLFTDLIDNIKSANENMVWYKEKKQTDIANKIMEYGLLYNQFAYSLPSFFTDLILVYMRINYAYFFKELQYDISLYNETNNQLNQQEIKKAINYIIDNEKNKYKKLIFNVDKLDFTDLCNFNASFVKQIEMLQLETSNN
jgi:hypothetical protein